MLDPLLVYNASKATCVLQCMEGIPASPALALAAAAAAAAAALPLHVLGAVLARPGRASTSDVDIMLDCLS